MEGWRVERGTRISGFSSSTVVDSMVIYIPQPHRTNIIIVLSYQDIIIIIIKLQYKPSIME